MGVPMRVRSVVMAVSAAAVVAATSIAVAPSVSAAEIAIAVDCDNVPITTTVEIAVRQGDTLRFDGTGQCDYADVSLGPVLGPRLFVNPADQGGPGPYIFTIRSDAPPGAYGSADDWALSVSDLYSGTYCPVALVPCGSSFFITVTAAPGGVGETPIPMWVQGYGRPTADAPCREGWDPSWAQWPNHGTGGFVCHRSIKAYGS